MADESAPTKAAAATEKAEEVVVETAVEAVEPVAAEDKSQTVEAKPVASAQQPVRRAETKKAEKVVAAPAPKPASKVKAVKKIEKAVAAPAPKPARKVKTAKKTAKKTARKLAVTAAIAVAAAKPVRAGFNKIKGVQQMTKTSGIDTGLFAADQFKSVFGDVNERTKTAMERSARIVEELADLTRGNVEAVVASSKVAAKGVEVLGQDAAEYSRKSFEEVSTALKGFAEVKSATDLFKLQGDFARAAFDSAVAESARFSETVLKFAGDIAEPITSRYTVAAERVKTLAA
jgi:phasin family protein